MKLAMLFFFYKEVEICRNRLRLIRRYNPDLSIYGLYGGIQEQVKIFQCELSPYLDDFYYYPEDKNLHWKWENGDLLISEWFCHRGTNLVWDTIVIVQWDMILAGSVKEVFKHLKEGEILLSGLRPVDEVSSWWPWIRPDNQNQHDRFVSFVKHIEEIYGFKETPLCCLYIVVCLPRGFLEQYVNVLCPEMGFIEYRVPTYAKIFKIPFNRTNQFNCWWMRDPNTKSVPTSLRVLNAGMYHVPLRIIIWHLLRREGPPIFHPYRRIFPIDIESLYMFLLETVKTIVFDFVNRLMSVRRLWRSASLQGLW